MTSSRGRSWLFLAVALALSAAPAKADDVIYGQPLVQTRFDQLIPTSYPIVRPRFDRLIKTSRPVIHPGVPEVPITADLVRPTDQPLLIANGGLEQPPAIRRKRELVAEHPQISARPDARPRSRGRDSITVAY